MLIYIISVKEVKNMTYLEIKTAYENAEIKTNKMKIAFNKLSETSSQAELDRFCHSFKDFLNLKSEEQLAYEEYVKLEQARKSLLKDMNEDDFYGDMEGLLAGTYADADNSFYVAQIKKINARISEILPLAQKWFDFCGNPNHIKLQ